MIVSFGDRGTEAVFHGSPFSLIRRYPADVVERAIRKLDLLNGAPQLSDMKVIPGNRLEALKGDLKGFHSIRVSDQWRIIFRWQGSDAHDVRLTDYH